MKPLRGHSINRGQADAHAVDVSVLVPVCERPEPLDGLYREYAAALQADGRTFEFIFIIEPYFQALAQSLSSLISRGEPIRVLSFAQTVGEAALLKAGASRARGKIVLTLPAYRRVTAGSLPDLLRRVDEGAHLVVAVRNARRDLWINRIQSRVFNRLIAAFARSSTRDIACGVRAMRPAVLNETPIYGDFFRFLPVLAAREGFRVEEIEARQHPSDFRTRVYGPGVYLRRLIDLLGLLFVLRFTDKPLRFFGLAGSLFSFAGALILAAVLVQRLGGQGIADRPLLLLGVVLVVLGVQVVALGLVGEIIVHLNASSRPPYRLWRETIEPGASNDKVEKADNPEIITATVPANEGFSNL